MAEEGKSIQSLGGTARAESLSEAQRQEIAKKGADGRWKLPRALFGSPEHPLKIGSVEIPCYVLEDNRRVLTKRGMVTALDMARGSSGGTGGDRLAKFVEGDRLKAFVSKELQSVTSNPIKFLTPGGSTAYGYEATVLADICDVVLSARKAGLLQKQQEHIAAQCEILVRGFARIGIIAMVDEATGYQEIRDRQALQKILDKYLTDEWAKWSKTFPDDFYRELFRLKGLDYPSGRGNQRPGYVGHWTNDVVYKRLAPGVLTELKKKNPRLPSGKRARTFHQHFTKDYGHPELKQHLSNVIFLMKTCVTDQEFKTRLDKVAPKHGETPLLNMDYGD